MSVTISTKYLGDYTTEATYLEASAKIVTSAKSIYDGGEPTHFSPTDLFVSSLTSCILTIMGITAKTRGFDIDGAEATTKKQMGKDPRRVSQIDIEIRLPRQYTDTQKKFLEAAARACPVGRSIHPDIIENIKFVYPE